MTTGRLRLLHLRDENEAASDAMNAERLRFDAIRRAEPTRAVQAFNLFQTPRAIAERMAAMLAPMIEPGGAWLEPSAGLGRLYRAGRAAGLSGPCVLVECAAECAAELYREIEGDAGASLLQRDFLTVPPGSVRGAIMNPPFRQGLDIRHTLRAVEWLEPGGALVGLCYDGARQRARLRPMAETWEPLPAGSFRSEGTDAGAVLFVIRK